MARDAPQVEAFVDEMERFSQKGDTLCTTPLLLNLMVSEYLRHEAKGSAIQFDGAYHARARRSLWSRERTSTCTCLGDELRV